MLIINFFKKFVVFCLALNFNTSNVNNKHLYNSYKLFDGAYFNTSNVNNKQRVLLIV